MPIKYIFLVTVILEIYIYRAPEFTGGGLLALKLSLSNSLSFKYFLSFILFPTQPCSATILLPTLCLSPPAAALNISKSAPVFLSVVSRHIPFHLFTTLPPPTKEPLLQTPLHNTGKADAIYQILGQNGKTEPEPERFAQGHATY